MTSNDYKHSGNSFMKHRHVLTRCITEQELVVWIGGHGEWSGLGSWYNYTMTPSPDHSCTAWDSKCMHWSFTALLLMAVNGFLNMVIDKLKVL